MTRRVSNFADLIQRVTASCLLHPLGDSRYEVAGDDEEKYEYESEANKDEEGENEEEEEDGEEYGNEKNDYDEENFVDFKVLGERKKVKETEALMEEVFEAVSAMKRAYVSLQEAHCPWDPEKMRVADMAVVAELRKIGVLRERFRRSRTVDDNGKRRGERRRGSGDGGGVTLLREVVAPYEAVVEELKNEVQAKDLEVQNLKKKLDSAVNLTANGGGKKVGKSQSRRKLGGGQIQGK